MTFGEDNRTEEVFHHEKRTWFGKFRDAFRGLRGSIRQQSSYRVHFFFTLLVPIVAWYFRFDAVRWCILVLCIGTVLGAEMFNTSIETLARAITDKRDERIGRALDIASGAVLLVSFAATACGLLLFVPALWGVI